MIDRAHSAAICFHFACGILSVVRRFDEIFQAVLLYIRECSDAAINRSTLLVACVRLLGAYLAQETEAIDEVNELLPFILTIRDADTTDTLDPITFLLPAFTQMAFDEKVSASFQCLTAGVISLCC